VADEMAYLERTFGARSVLFRDPVFSLDKKRAAELAEAVSARRLGIEWACETHLARLDEELVDLMAAAGCRGINVGIESVDPNVLKSVKRYSDDFSHQEAIIRYCETKGIRIGAFYIFGNPEDTKETIRATIAYAQALETSYAQFTLNTPYVGTAYYEVMRPKLIETQWERYDIYTPTFEHAHLTKEELLELKEEAYRRYYFRPSWISRHLMHAARSLMNGRAWPHPSIAHGVASRA
jgi:anaerobic magnesium-protoporphyrin IX monomethyl ester cyclase